MKWSGMVRITVMLAMVVFSAAAGVTSASGKALRIGDLPPPVSLVELKGSRLRVPDDFRGKVVLLHFWAGGCSSCREEMPAMEGIWKSLGRKGLVILAVNVGQGRETVQRLVREMGITYPVLLDPRKEAAALYDVVGLPRTYLVDRKGVIRYKILGSAAPDDLSKKIASLL